MSRTALLAAWIFASWTLALRADEPRGPEPRILGNRQNLLQEVGPKRSLIVGLEVFVANSFGNDLVQGLRPIYLDAQGRELLGSLRGKAPGKPIRLKAKRGYALGTLSAKTSQYIDGLSLTFMKIENGLLDGNKCYESEWTGGRGGWNQGKIEGNGRATVGMIGSENEKHELCGVGLIFSDKPVIALQAARRAAIPDADAQAKAVKEAKEIFGAQWNAAKTLEQKRELVLKLLRAAGESDGDPVSRYVLLKLAKDMATQATDGLAAFEAIDLLAEQFQVDEVELKFGVLTAFAKRAKLPVEHKSVGDQAVGLIEKAIAADNFDLAQKLCDLAQPAARASRDAPLQQEVKDHSEQIKPLAAAYEEMKKVAAVLDQTPDDPAANLAVGRYSCFYKGDWDKGVPMLALGSDEALKQVAIQEISGVSPGDEVKVADAWWDLAEKQQGKPQKMLRDRAGYWYEKALPELTGLARQKAEKRLGECEPRPDARIGKKPQGPVLDGPGKYRPGLVAEYFHDKEFRRRALGRIDAKVDFDWGDGAPVPGVGSDYFSIQWQGAVKVPRNGRYTFFTHSQHGVRLTIDGTTCIDQLTTHGVPDHRAEVHLTAGYHTFKLEYIQGWGQAYCQIGWQLPGGLGRTVIPPSSLFHEPAQEQAAGVGEATPR